MAKKKQIELTIEEKLQNALVPKEEQPYKIPNNWCWIRLLESFINKTDSKKKIKQKDYLEEGNYPIVDQGKDLIGGYTNDDKLIIYIRKPIIVFGDHTRCIKYIDFDFVQGADGTKILEPKKFFLEKYFYYAFKNINIPSLGYRRHYPMFNKLKIQIAPIKEQQRIVNRIESLFTKLDKAKELIENTLAQFEQNKMAILHKAFTGELTEKWRKENNINDIKEASNIEKIPYIVPNGWYWDKLENITIRIVDGDHNPPAKEKEKTNYIMLSAQNIGYSGFINMDKVRYLSKDNFDKCHKRTCLEDEDILFSSVGSIGNTMVYREKENDKITFQRSVTIIKTKINPYYLRYVLLSPYCQQIFKTESIGTAQKGFYIKQMKNLIVPVPTIEEQQEIVNILDKLLAKYNKIKDLEKQLEQIELLKKAILAKAFRGELGTNNPDEESAEVLLKEILAEK